MYNNHVLLIHHLPSSSWKIFRKFDIPFHCYTNDTQLYLPTKPTSTLPTTSLYDYLQEIQNDSLEIYRRVLSDYPSLIHIERSLNSLETH